MPNTYTGEKDASGRPHGKGTLTYSDGNVYSGEFEEGIPHGVGVFTWAEGGSFEGEWERGAEVGKYRLTTSQEAETNAGVTETDEDLARRMDSIVEKSRPSSHLDSAGIPSSTTDGETWLDPLDDAPLSYITKAKERARERQAEQQQLVH